MSNEKKEYDAIMRSVAADVANRVERATGRPAMVLGQTLTTDVYRWDSPPSDPIADIRRAMEADAARARYEAVMVPFQNARIAALAKHAKATAADVDRAQRVDASDVVWLCDEHGVLPTVRQTSMGEMTFPLRVPRAVAVALGAEIRDAHAHLTLGVPAVPLEDR